MEKSRRNFLKSGTGLAVATSALVALSSCEEEPKASVQAPKPMVGACGLSCDACPAKKAGKCKGCGAGNSVSAEMVQMKNCPVLNCASKKKIAYCGTDCMKFTDCQKLIGRPYDKSYMEKIKAKLA